MQLKHENKKCNVIKISLILSTKRNNAFNSVGNMQIEVKAAANVKKLIMKYKLQKYVSNSYPYYKCVFTSKSLR